MDKESASFLLSIIGITNTVGRVVCGALSDHPKVKFQLFIPVQIYFLNNNKLLLGQRFVGE